MAHRGSFLKIRYTSQLLHHLLSVVLNLRRRAEERVSCQGRRHLWSCASSRENPGLILQALPPQCFGKTGRGNWGSPQIKWGNRGASERGGPQIQAGFCAPDLESYIPQNSPIWPNLDERARRGEPGQQPQGRVDVGGGQRGGLFLPFLSCLPLGKSLNHSKPQSPHL